MLRKHRVVRQSDGSDCGSAALATVALYHRRPLRLEVVRELAGNDRQGTNLFGLVRAAEQLGFAARGVKGSFDDLGVVPLPAIAHTVRDGGLGHFVVVFAVRHDMVVVGDPAGGVRKLTRADFSSRWSGYLLLVVPDAAASSRFHGAPARPWRRFVGLVAFHRGLLFEAFCCALLMVLLGISTSYFIQHLVDSVLVRGEARLLNALGLGMLAVVGFRTLFGVVRQYLLAHVGRKVDLSLVAGYTRHLLDLPARFFETRRVGEILSRTRDTEKVREAISGTTLTAVADGVLVVSTIAVLWCYDLPLAAVATAFVPLLVAAVAAHHSLGVRRSREAMEDAAQLSAHLVENVQGIESIKALGLQSRRAEEGESRLVKTAQSIFSLQKIGISMEAGATLVTGVAGIVVLWFGGHRVMAGALTIGQLMFFYTLLGYMLEPLRRLACTNLEIQEALVAVDRLYQVLDLETESGGPRDRRDGIPFAGLRDAIEFDGVTFGYGCRPDVIRGLDLRVAAGSTVAIIGESGSGKSTLLKLLQRFHDPVNGRLLLDGIDARDLDLETLRDRIGVVSQDPVLFSGTIRENISLGRPDASVREIIAASQAAGLHGFVSELPERYDTVVGERGANLSGGQRQRLAIARALLRDPDILLLDEATSHLDTETERVIQAGLRSAFAGKTVIVVAHRLSTIREADAIHVLHGGRIVETGTHDELMERQGRYCRFSASQTAGEPALTLSAEPKAVLRQGA